MRAVVAVLAGLIVVPTVSLEAWGMDVHRFLTRRAIEGLPSDIRPFFAARIDFISEHSVDPDLWRIVGLSGVRGEESPNHFLDIDGLDEPRPFTGVPREWDAYVARYGLDRANQMGRVPWRVEELYGRLVEAFRQVGGDGPAYAADNARYLAAVLAHYVEDAHQPFHAVLNYDGQLTGQRGIHARFETALVLRNRWHFVLTPVAIQPIPDAREFIFQTLVSSEALVEPILTADREAAAADSAYGDAYYEALRAGAGDIAVRRLSESASGVASLIVAAWAEAGRPVLPGGVAVPAPVRPLR